MGRVYGAAHRDAGRIRTRSPRSWVPYAAAAWALIFAALHFVWALGWYVGLDPEAARAAFAVRWKLIYDLVAGAICAIAVPVALALGMPWGRRVPRRVLGVLAWTGTGLLVLRSVAGLIQTGYLLAAGRYVFRPMDLWELWFYLGAVLFSLATWRSGRVNRNWRWNRGMEQGG
jgi:hypothetical protein